MTTQAKQNLIDALVEAETLLDCSDSALDEMGQTRKGLEKHVAQVRADMAEMDRRTYVDGVQS